mmetsp:Transcript_28523/g.69550  ORF Transcript_28523/g.69550 Transcript_28523/m.69550 type:complete len:109 (+) Transcript_28523:1803-2129(+)
MTRQTPPQYEVRMKSDHYSPPFSQVPHSFLHPVLLPWVRWDPGTEQEEQRVTVKEVQLLPLARLSIEPSSSWGTGVWLSAGNTGGFRAPEPPSAPPQFSLSPEEEPRP